VIVDVMNPEGVDIVMRNLTTSGNCWRGNAKGVDLNRNFPHPYKHLKRSVALTRDEENPGPYDLSEWESVSLVSIMKKEKPTVFLTVHSGDIAVLIPYDGSMKKNPRFSVHLRAAENSIGAMCKGCKIGSSILTLGYESFGTMTDYAADHLSVKYVYTLETFYNNTHPAGDEDCVSRFNPNPRESKTQEIVARIWSEKFIPALINEIYYEEVVKSRAIAVRSILKFVNVSHFSVH
jgi:hypothetical protein